MNSETNTSKIEWIVADPPGSHASSEELLEFAKENNWDFKVLGRAPIPQEPVTLGKWMIVPDSMDKDIKNLDAVIKRQAILNAKLYPRGFVIAHEIPKDPKKTNDSPSRKIPEGIPDEYISKNIFSSIEEVLGSLIKGIGSLLPFVILPLLLIDPILIAITEDYVWIEIERWWE